MNTAWLIKKEDHEVAEMKFYKIKVTVESVEGKCPLGNVPGKEFIIERTTPAGMCMSAYQAISPAIQVLRFGGSFPWEKDPDVARFACPDPVNRTIYKIERVGEVFLRT